MLNKLMSFVLAGGAGAAGAPQAGEGWVQEIVNAVYKIVNKLVWPIMAIILTLGIIYVIILGVNYAKAETSDKKEEAKKRIINAVVGVVITLALIALIYVLLSNFQTIKNDGGFDV